MLTEKQKAFCDYYIEPLNATESYNRAYPNVKNIKKELEMKKGKKE